MEEGQAIKPVVILGVSHREQTWSISDQSALEPGRDGTCETTGHRWLLPHRNVVIYSATSEVKHAEMHEIQ